MTTQLDVSVREVTQEECEYFFDRGWVFLPQLITSDTAVQLRALAEQLLGVAGDGERPSDRMYDRTGKHDVHLFHEYYNPSKDFPLFAAVHLHPEMGRNAARLLGRDTAIRPYLDEIAVKLPVSNQSGHLGKAETGPHQDGISDTPVAASSLAIWIALVEITPEMGAMRFYEGSHRFGLLGPDPVSHPYVSRWELSDPLTYQPGDATAHFGLTLHSAPLNMSDRPRWGWINGYFPGDAPYNGRRHYYIDTLRDGGEIEVGRPLDHPEYPTVYTPPGYVPPNYKPLSGFYAAGA